MKKKSVDNSKNLFRVWPDEIQRQNKMTKIRVIYMMQRRKKLDKQANKRTEKNAKVFFSEQNFWSIFLSFSLLLVALLKFLSQVLPFGWMYVLSLYTVQCLWQRPTSIFSSLLYKHQPKYTQIHKPLTHTHTLTLTNVDTKKDGTICYCLNVNICCSIFFVYTLHVYINIFFNFIFDTQTTNILIFLVWFGCWYHYFTLF